MKGDLIILIYIGLITLDALADALFFKGRKKASKNVEVIFKMGLFSVCLMYLKDFGIDYIIFAGTIYLFLQMALFDLLFNKFAGLNLVYRGTTSSTEDILEKIESMTKWDKAWIWVWRGWWFGLALFIHFMKFRQW
jgi:hypothetical protein